MTKISLLATLAFIVTGHSAFAEKDQPFKQAISHKYTSTDFNGSTILKKVITDYNDNVYVLTDKGIYIVSENKLVKDLRYTPLAKKIPLDIAIQEEAGHVYYLYEDQVLTNGYAGVPFKKLPAGKYNRLAVKADGSILLTGNAAVTLLKDNVMTDVTAPAGKIKSVQAYKGNFYILNEQGIYSLTGNRFESIHKANNARSFTFRDQELVVANAAGYYGINANTGDTSFPLQTKTPSEGINDLQNINGSIWAATDDGVYMREASGSYRYYASKRWLNQNKSIDLTSDSKGNVFVLTPDGLNEIEFKEQTLAEKTTYFQDRIRQRHIRYGFISQVTFQQPGDITTAQLTDTDNDGLWSAFYLGSQAFRYAVTKDKAAKRYAMEAFEAFERIISVNPLKGFPARTFERTGYKKSDPDRWHSSTDSIWEWKGTTSSDEFVGYIWVAALLNEMVVETESEKKRVADFIDKILTHIIDNNYYFIDFDGKPTLWGRWNPEYINSFPPSVGDRKLGSTTIIAGLQLGYALTGKELYKTEAFRLMKDHGYLNNILTPYTAIQPTENIIHQGVNLGNGGWNHSDDEMAFLTYWVLYHYAFTDQLRQQFKDVINDHWKIEAPEKNPVWNLVTLGTTGTFDKEGTVWQLKEFPMDLIRWKVVNSKRKDLTLLEPNFRHQFTKELLPAGEYPVHRHNANGFNLDGGDGGKTELAGDEYLLPYWMARYLKVIE